MILSKLIESAIEETLEDSVAISFSGGLDSTTIATVAKKHAKIDLYSVGTDKSSDLDFSRKIAQEIKLQLNEIVVDEKELVEAYLACYKIVPLDFLKLEILVPVYLVAKAASKKHSVLLFGSGAEELFVGYKKYFDYLKEGKDVETILKEEFKTLVDRDINYVKKICRKFSIEARFPFYNKKLADFVFTIPLEDKMADPDLKKCILREAAKMLGVSELAIKRKKLAMQYGSGIHKLLLKHSKEFDSIISKS